MSDRFIKVAQLKSVDIFRERLAELGLELPCDDEILTAADDSPMALPIIHEELEIGNRWCIHPMEGWDANPDGTPSELTLRRWRHFGLSGAKWIWGGEAAAVQPDGRANPNQTLGTPSNADGLRQLYDTLIEAHEMAIGEVDDLMVGLQLTHSGRYSKPNKKDQAEPRIAYHHPVLDRRVGISPEDDSLIWTDDDLERLIDNYVIAAEIAADIGFQFVDVKCCHGYLLHEFLTAHNRPGPYGGDFEGRTKLLTTIIDRIHEQCPGLMVGVRLSLFDMIPFESAVGGGRPIDHQDLLPYPYAFGANPENPLEIDLSEPIKLIRLLYDIGVFAVNLSAGSPYYNPHIQRPAIFPPTDGYQPPEDPLVGVVRQIQTARQCKEAVPEMLMVGTGYTYLQEYLPHVAQAVIREGWIDSVGLGRMVLSYPDLPHETLTQGTMPRKKICRTFSDCTSGPRQGLISGCFPLDPFYKEHPEAALLKERKQQAAEA
ncbi:MAG: NADH:flavin oxidoreductase [Pirellulaceae bacterium]